MEKRFWQSKTFWVNAITLVAALLPPVREFLVGVGLPTEWGVSALAIINVALRLVTGQPIKVK